jgi:Ni/Co efflux regulator RcnB
MLKKLLVALTALSFAAGAYAQAPAKSGEPTKSEATKPADTKADKKAAKAEKKAAKAEKKAAKKQARKDAKAAQKDAK